MNIATKDLMERAGFSPALRRRDDWQAAIRRPSWTEWTALVIASVTVLRAIVGITTGLSDTEAYYAQWARFPSLSYYDHPPLVAWTTWIALRLAGAHAWHAVRLGPVFYAAAFDILLFRLASRLFSPRAGFFAVVLVTAIPVFFFTGFLVNPEGLLAPLWTLFLLLLLDLRDHDEPWRPLAVGAVVGVAFLAKYTAVLAIPVALLFVAGRAETRRWLRRPTFYLAGVVALAIATPVLVWNAQHHWPSLQLHLSERMKRSADESLAAALWRVWRAQLLYFQPVILPALLGVIAYAVGQSRRDQRYRFLAVASLPVLAFLLTMMVRAGDSEPHWTMVGYVPLIVAAGGLLDESAGGLRRLAHATLQVALVLSAGEAALFTVHLRSPVLARAMPSYDANADPVAETVGWGDVRAAVGAHVAGLGPGAVVAGAHNVLCGHLQEALDDSPPVYCASPRRTEYDFVGRRTPPGVPVVFVDSDRYPEDPTVALPRHACTRTQSVDVERAGLHVGRYRIYDCMPRAEAVP